MGKAALLAILAFGISGAYYSLGTQSGIMGAERGVVDHQKEVLARNAALVGHDRAEQLLGEKFADGSVNRVLEGTYEGVDYVTYIRTDGGGISVPLPGGESIDLSTATNRGVILSVAYQENAEGEEEPVYFIKTGYERELVPVPAADREAPDWMQNAITAGGDVILRGNSSAGVDEGEIDAEGDERDRLNANIHANGVLSVRGNVDVEGFGTTAQYAEVIGNVEFDPNYNPTDADAIQEGVDPVEIPPFDAATFVAEMGGADQVHDDGNLKFTGNHKFDLGGTRDAPYIWYIEDGMLELAGNVSFSGYVLFVAEEGFKITGNVSMGEGFEGPQESNIAIYTGKTGTIDFRGNMTLYGQIFAAQGVDFDASGNVDVYGNVTTGGDVTLKGNVEFRYRSPSPAFFPPEMKKSVRVAVHKEW